MRKINTEERQSRITLSACVEEPVLPRSMSASDPLRFSTLSWSMWGDDEGCNDQAPEFFLSSLRSACGAVERQELVLCSGMTVTKVPPVRSILEASGGAPVVFEATGGGYIWLAWRGSDGVSRTTRLRDGQILFRHNDPARRFKETAEAVAQRHGVLRFEGSSICFVILVCGENNVLGGGRSVFKNQAVSNDRSARLSTILGVPWVLLNPAHRPYFPQIASTGFAKVGHVNTPTYEAGPTIGKITKREKPYRDKTCAPVAVLHANNFRLSLQETLPYASVAFGKRVKAIGNPVQGEIANSTGAGPATWRFARYTIRG